MPLIVPGGTLRLISRPGMGRAAPPVVGFGVLPFPDGVQPGDVLHVRLLPDGSATWRVVESGVLTDELKPNPNGQDFNQLFESGDLSRLCWPELIEHQRKVKAGGELAALAETTDTYLL